MKKTAFIILTASLLALLCACAPLAGTADTTDNTTIPVTSPEGFEDVTAPPVADTTAKPEEDTTAAKTEDTTDTEKAEDTTEAPILDADGALGRARAWLGESDPDTGYKYAFSYDGMMTEGGVEYFKIRVSWYIEDQERYSLCGYLLVSPDGDVSKYSW